jgi:uncharacterized NAD(P)/FAD-binding protein YdhS
LPSSAPYHCSIAIVGGGCSGVLVAVQLFRGGFRGLVNIVEPREQLGAGLAYSTPYDQHLLNVPAGKMSALPDCPGHFLEWLRAGHAPDADGFVFAPRKLYGPYLRDLLNETLGANQDRFKHIRAEALSVSADSSIALSNGSEIHAERIVLALGNPASCTVHGPARDGLEYCWELSPWFNDSLRVRFPGERILLLGTGLTAVDAALALQSQETQCQVYMLSRRGLLPQVHDLSAPPLSTSSSNLRELCREVRAAGPCWRGAVDALRPASNQLWRDLTLADRRRFLRHLKSYWEPHRHRMAPEIWERLRSHLRSGAVEIVRGRICRTSGQDGNTKVVVRLRGGGEHLLEVDRIISCTGILEDYNASPRPLIRSLIDSGFASANDLGIGFRTDDHGRLTSNKFWTIGPPRRGELFETTAVPEIRVQAESVARQLIAELCRTNSC